MSINTPGLSSRTGGIVNQQSVPLADKRFFQWIGVAVIPAGVTVASLDIKLPSQMKGYDDVASLVVPADAEITRVGFKVSGDVTIAAATGKLKLATALASAATTLYVESAAASGGSLVAADPVQTINPLDATTSVGASDVTYKLYATNGGAAGAATASTVTATVDTRVLVCISGYLPSAFPGDDSFPEFLPQFVDTAP